MSSQPGERGLVAALGLVAAILASGFAVGHLNGRGSTPRHTPAASAPSPVTTRAAPVSVSRINPITGPNKPPLSAERSGPFGSRRTTGTAEVALTFDDGPDPHWTPQVLQMLHQYQVKATFCLIGVNVARFPSLVRDIASSGHTLCNHSWQHDMMLGFLPSESIIRDLTRTNNAIRAAAPGSRVSYYRQPGGNWTPAVVAAARRMGMTSLHWQVDPQDWGDPAAHSIARVVNSSTVAGAIVLLHDGGGDRGATMSALHSILPNLSARFRLAALPAGVDPPLLFGIDRPAHQGQD
jgi:peptidoglycan/xylan/chitin deacetylase (PgdA/CDA1 family)